MPALDHSEMDLAWCLLSDTAEVVLGVGPADTPRAAARCPVKPDTVAMGSTKSSLHRIWLTFSLNTMSRCALRRCGWLLLYAVSACLATMRALRLLVAAFPAAVAMCHDTFMHHLSLARGHSPTTKLPGRPMSLLRLFGLQGVLPCVFLYGCLASRPNSTNCDCSRAEDAIIRHYPGRCLAWNLNASSPTAFADAAAAAGRVDGALGNELHPEKLSCFVVSPALRRQRSAQVAPGLHALPPRRPPGRQAPYRQNPV